MKPLDLGALLVIAALLTKIKTRTPTPEEFGLEKLKKFLGG